MSFAHIINPAGGLYYHFIAFRYKKKLWSDFANAIDQFLNQWCPTEENLIIFGSSAGHCLKTNFLKKFKRIILIDPDPLAKYIFSANHKNICLVQDSQNYLRYGVQGLKTLPQSYPNHALLFSNIIGQIPFLVSSENSESSDLADALRFLFSSDFQKLSWASFHDVYSFHFTQEPRELCWPLILQGHTLNECLESIRLQTQLRPLRVEVIDHQTDRLFSSCEQQFRAIWKRTPTSYHIVDGYSQNC